MIQWTSAWCRSLLETGVRTQHMHMLIKTNSTDKLIITTKYYLMLLHQPLSRWSAPINIACHWASFNRVIAIKYLHVWMSWAYKSIQGGIEISHIKRSTNGMYQPSIQICGHMRVIKLVQSWDWKVISIVAYHKTAIMWFISFYSHQIQLQHLLSILPPYTPSCCQLHQATFFHLLKWSSLNLYTASLLA